jgi:hypothetical protein
MQSLINSLARVGKRPPFSITALFSSINHNVQTRRFPISSISAILVWFTHLKSAVKTGFNRIQVAFEK